MRFIYYRKSVLHLRENTFHFRRIFGPSSTFHIKNKMAMSNRERRILNSCYFGLFLFLMFFGMLVTLCVIWLFMNFSLRTFRDFQDFRSYISSPIVELHAWFACLYVLVLPCCCCCGGCCCYWLVDWVVDWVRYRNVIDESPSVQPGAATAV